MLKDGKWNAIVSSKNLKYKQQIKKQKQILRKLFNVLTEQEQRDSIMTMGKSNVSHVEHDQTSLPKGIRMRREECEY